MENGPGGERERVTRLFLKHQPMLQEYIHGLLRDAHDAEDLFQEVGVEILHKAVVPPRSREIRAVVPRRGAP